MKFTVKRENFSDIMALITMVVNPRHTNPIVHNVLLELSDARLVFRATDLEISLQYGLSDVESKKQGKALLPAVRLANLLKDLHAEFVTVEQKKDSVHINAEREHIALQCGDIEGFPGFPEFQSKGSLTVPGLLLYGALDRTVKSIAAEKGRFALNGVYLSPGTDVVEICGTDGRRLSYVCMKSKAKKYDFPVIIPRRGVELINRLVERVKDQVELDVRENEIVGRVGDAIFSTQLVEGQYPDFWSVIPRDNDKKFVVNRGDIHNALKVVSHVSGPESQGVKFVIKKKELQIHAQSFGTGTADIVVPILYDGPETTIGFDPRYLRDGLATFVKDDVVCEFRDGNTGVIFHEGAKDEFFYLVMPLEVD